MATKPDDTTAAADGAQATAPQASADSAQPLESAALEEPQAGGRYLRNPITGALTANPD